MKQKNEMDKFNDVMDKLLTVSYSDLKKKLDEEKAAKKKKPVKTSSSDRVSDKTYS